MGPWSTARPGCELHRAIPRLGCFGLAKSQGLKAQSQKPSATLLPFDLLLCLLICSCFRFWGSFDPSQIPSANYPFPLSVEVLLWLKANGQVLMAGLRCLYTICGPNNGSAMIAWLLAFLSFPPPAWDHPGR